MKISLPQLLLGCCCAFTLLVGCGRMVGTFPNGYPPPSIGYPPPPVGYPRQPVIYPGQPIGYPGQPISYPNQPVNPQPYPGGSPWYDVGYRPQPGRPGIPIVMNPDPFPTIPTTPEPTPPDTTFPDPGPPTNPVPRPPTEPIQPTEPTPPTDNVTDFWSPWPLPPRGNQLAARAELSSASNSGTWERGGLFDSANRKPTRYVRSQRNRQANSTSGENLKYRGGRTIRDLYYVNLYVSGDTEWSTADVESIDGSVAAAMRDEHLNNVLLQYFNNQTIRSTPLPSHPLVGYTPQTVTRGDIQNYVTYLLDRGFLDSYDLDNTAFNFLLPRGTVLTDGSTAANSIREDINAPMSGTVPGSEDGDSRNGMGGYHGSVVTANDGRVYFSVSVYSERLSPEQTNGIPVFREPWKNIVATLYHQLSEIRTNPDVEDALRSSSDLTTDSNLGWVSDAGHEIGDLVLQSDVPLTNVIIEVPLADGSGMVPVQLLHSNHVRGPEGPIGQPHALRSR